MNFKEQNRVILPPATLGILGGGQLGMMFTIAAKTMGYNVVVLDPDVNAPTQMFADKHICKPYDDPEALQELKQCAAVTTEFENVSVSLMKQLAQSVRVSSSGECVAISQNRIIEKEKIREAGLQTVPYRVIESDDDCSEECLNFFPGILKTATLGYDGKGQIVVNDLRALKKAFSDLKKVPCVLEKKLDLQSEASVVVCRLDSETIQCFPVADNVHKNGILFTSTVPSILNSELQERLKNYAIQLADDLDYVGVLTVEFFIVNDAQKIYVNEIAPRPHNSGHYTLDATLCSQFQQQVRILCGLPPLDTSLLRACTMVNILGDLWPQKEQEPDWQILLQEPFVHLHLYSKKEARPGRKMGHFNVLSDTPEKSLSTGLNLFSHLESDH
ncbi:5-(carboxyamino)imidazole ribonucleotide synthase [Neisseriaceae bacterium PsAf]|nr:5-(carboxyamino)imidazole ribonucleotide synthase [Neisseriaceae bacterium PsAf]MCV2503846.1 5-(carboxyamino)imidazole ribonucleotide synthase [Neisseriaceae bacterium]